MTKIIGVRFRNAGKVYWFDPKEFEMKAGLHVIVETARGLEYGTVVGEIKEIEDEQITQPLKSVVRLATSEDEEQISRNAEKEKQAVAICKEKIRAHELEMKLIDAEYAFDNTKILFYFTADGRIDFRDLVKDLASVFRTRIELRQIGVRDEAKILGGIGICGRPLCCHTWLSDFAPVSIKMAKEQSLSLNPAKISGVCGRLMCCLKNEQETYEYLNSKLPNVGENVTLPDGRVGTVSETNVLRQRVKVLVNDLEDDEKELEEYPVEDLFFRSHHKKEKAGKKDKDAKNQKEGKQKEGKGNRETREGKNARDRKETKENREGADSREDRDLREDKDIPENKGSRDARKDKDSREGNKEARDTRKDKENRENNKETRDTRKDKEDREDNKETRDTQNRDENADSKKKRGNQNRGRETAADVDAAYEGSFIEDQHQEQDPDQSPEQISDQNPDQNQGENPAKKKPRKRRRNRNKKKAAEGEGSGQNNAPSEKAAQTNGEPGNEE